MVYHRTQSEWVKELPRMESLTGDTRERDNVCRYLNGQLFHSQKSHRPL